LFPAGSPVLPSRDRYRRAGSRPRDEHRRRQSLHTHVWKAYVDPAWTRPRGQGRQDHLAGGEKFGALLVHRVPPTQFALDLQLLGGVWTCRRCRRWFRLFFGWFRAPALLAGWLAGFALGTTRLDSTA